MVLTMVTFLTENLNNTECISDISSHHDVYAEIELLSFNA